jgi:hypothetical protein
MPTDLPDDCLRYCCRCRLPLESRSVARAATFHPDCRKEDRKARRRWKASRNCRLCGRPASKRKAAAAKDAAYAPGAHGDFESRVDIVKPEF